MLNSKAPDTFPAMGKRTCGVNGLSKATLSTYCATSGQSRFSHISPLQIFTRPDVLRKHRTRGSSNFHWSSRKGKDISESDWNH